MLLMAGILRALGRGSWSHDPRRVWTRYEREARRPLHCLLFLVPLAVVYEIGAAWVARGDSPGRGPLAQSMIHGLLAWFGVAGFWVPGVVLVLSLLVWHRLRRDHWRMHAWVLAGMIGESLVLTIPLLVLSGLFPQERRPAAAGLLAELVRVLGAGVYEELVFRLLLISGLTWLLAEFVRLRGNMALGLAVGVASIVFSRCHFSPIGSDAFAWGSFCFRLTAGVYLSAVFLGRGPGVSGGCHVAYNILLVLLRSGAAD